jgi:hypothetical protein
LARAFYELMHGLSHVRTRIILLRYPRLVKDPRHLYPKIKPILKGKSYRTFLRAFRQVVNLQLVHQFTDSDR